MSRVYCTVELSYSPTLSKGQARGEVGVVMVIFSDSVLLVEVGILGGRHDLLHFCHHNKDGYFGKADRRHLAFFHLCQNREQAHKLLPKR